MLIDSHLHLSNEDYDIDKIIKDAKSNNVQFFVTGGTNKENNKKDIELGKKYNEIFITLGYHPEYAKDITEKDLKLLEKQIKNNFEIVVAIGEIGLDYHYENTPKEKKIQKEIFIKQIELAKKYNLPIVVHSRDATLDTINILKNRNITGIIHCFSGSLETAKEYINLGFMLGIGGVVTFKNSNLKDIIKEIDLKNIVLETDSPYLSPNRGKKNEPKNILLIAKKICELKETNMIIVEKVILENTIKILNLGKKSKKTVDFKF